MRAFRKAWQNRRPGWTRRVRWLEGTVAGVLSIRLNFVDEDGECNRFYDDVETAEAEYQAFIAGELSVVELMAA